MKIIRLYLFILMLLLTGCLKGVLDPTALAPASPQSSWVKADKSILRTSKYCEAIIPENLQNENLSLAELIDIGLLNNPSTKATWAEAKSKAASYGQSLSKYFPEIDVEGSYEKERSSNVLPGFSQTFNQTTYTPEVNITYTVFDFGKIKNTSIAARQALYFADLTHNRQIQSVIKTIMDDYYNLELQKAELLALDKDLDTATTTLDAAFVKFESGAGSIDDITQARTNYLQTKINFIEQKKAIQFSYASLINNIGLPANIEISIEKFPEEVSTDIILTSVDSLITEAQTNRPDLLASEANLEENQANLNLAKSQFFPTITADFDLGKDYYQKHHQEDFHYTFLLKLKFPLFKGFYDKNEVVKQKANFAKAKANLQKMELEVIKEVTNSHFSVKIASETLKYTKEYLETANKRYDIAILKYKAGLNDILDVLSAQSFLQDARKKYVQGKKEWYSSIADLAYSTGTICKCEKTRT